MPFIGHPRENVHYPIVMYCTVINRTQLVPMRNVTPDKDHMKGNSTILTFFAKALKQSALAKNVRMLHRYATPRVHKGRSTKKRRKHVPDYAGSDQNL